VYIIGGILLNKYARHIEGKEAFPNYSFWTDLPSLIKVCKSYSVLWQPEHITVRYITGAMLQNVKKLSPFFSNTLKTGHPTIDWQN